MMRLLEAWNQICWHLELGLPASRTVRNAVCGWRQHGSPSGCCEMASWVRKRGVAITGWPLRVPRSRRPLPGLGLRPAGTLSLESPAGLDGGGGGGMDKAGVCGLGVSEWLFSSRGLSFLLFKWGNNPTLEPMEFKHARWLGVLEARALGAGQCFGPGGRGAEQEERGGSRRPGNFDLGADSLDPGPLLRKPWVAVTGPSKTKDRTGAKPAHRQWPAAARAHTSGLAPLPPSFSSPLATIRAQGKV